MIGLNVTVDLSKLKPNLDKRVKKMQLILDTQVIKDSNFYAPQMDGALQNSVLIASDIGSGAIEWDTPYARKLYYNPDYHFSTDKNPNARGLWFESAKADFITDWIKIVEKVR